MLTFICLFLLANDTHTSTLRIDAAAAKTAQWTRIVVGIRCNALDVKVLSRNLRYAWVRLGLVAGPLLLLSPPCAALVVSAALGLAGAVL